MFSDNYVNLCAKAGKSASAVAKDIGFSGAAGNKWANGSMPHKPTLVRIADYFGITVSELVGDEFRSPHITDDYVTFPVLGKVAAGYNKLELQDWQDFDGDTVDIPQTWLKGRDYKDYFVVRVNGDSMYPQ